MKVGLLSICVALMPFTSTATANEVLAVCKYDKTCISVKDCQQLEKPIEYKLCVKMNDQGTIAEQGATIWVGNEGPIIDGTPGNFAEYTSTIFGKANPKAVSVVEWVNPDSLEKPENKYTLFAEHLMGISAFYTGDPRVEPQLPFYTGYCHSIPDETCEGEY